MNGGPRSTRRGSVYVLVLGASLLVTLIGVSAVMVVRVEQRAAQDEQDFVGARYYALSAIERGLLAIASDSSWRTARPNGMWFTNTPLGSGTFSLKAVDPADADLTDCPCDPLVLTGYGCQGAASQILQVTLNADAAAFDPLRDAINARGPLAYWRLGEPDEATAGDQTGSHPGIYRNGVTTGINVPFRCDTAARFDGTNDYVEIPHAAAFLLNSGTVQFWLRADSVASLQGLFVKDSLDFDTGGHLGIFIDWSQHVWVRLQSTGDNYYVQSGSISASQWYQVALTFGSGGMTLYLNGNAVDFNPYSGGLGTSSGGSGNFEPITIGVNSSNSNDFSTTPWDYPFRGLIDEVAIFPQALTPANVKTLYDAGVATPPHTMTMSLGSWQQAVN